VQVMLQRKDVTTPGFVQRIRGEGMPKKDESSRKGDLIITYSLNFPKRLSEEQKEQARRLLAPVS
jgi:DnaJ-class molecular chaperone